MAIFSLDGPLLRANEAFHDVLGYSGAELVGFRPLDFLHPDDNAAAPQQLARLQRGETSVYRGEHQLKRADGTALWANIAANVLAGPWLTSPLLVVQLIKIELQKRAEEALAAAERRWNFALESARQGVWDHDLQTDTMFYSRMWRIMRGLSADELIPADHKAAWLSRIHPDDLDTVLRNINRQDETSDGTNSLEYRERKSDGSYVWILSQGGPVAWDDGGHPIRTLGTDTDITRLKCIELELAAEKERLRVTLDSIADGMISTNEAGQVMFINPAAELLTGYGSEQALGRYVWDVFSLREGATGQPRECPVVVCLATDETVHLDDDMILLDLAGVKRDIRCTASPVKMPGGTLSGAVLVFQDVTQSRAMQRQLAYSASHDALTGLPNRAAFDPALNAAISTARHEERRHCLLYIDLDRFKSVNDTAGHAAGDALLCQVAAMIRGSCRSHDMAARIGGDEFAVLLRDCTGESGKAVADNIVRVIGALEFSWDNRTYGIGASVGMTTISGASASPLGFIGEADAACYAAKSNGRGVAVIYRDI